MDSVCQVCSHLGIFGNCFGVKCDVVGDLKGITGSSHHFSGATYVGVNLSLRDVLA